MSTNYTGVDFQLPFDPTGFTQITPADLAQLVGGIGPINNAGGVSIGLFIKSYDDDLGNPTVPNTTLYPKLINYGWLRVSALTGTATLYAWNDNGASQPTLNQWYPVQLTGVGQITGSQIASNTITDSNIFSVSWSKLPSGAAVGGCLTGSMPNPALANGAVGAAAIAAQSIDYTKLVPSATAFQELRVNSAANAVEWASNRIIQAASIAMLPSGGPGSPNLAGNTTPTQGNTALLSLFTGNVNTFAFTPLSAGSMLRITCSFSAYTGGAYVGQCALFLGTTLVDSKFVPASVPATSGATVTLTGFVNSPGTASVNISVYGSVQNSGGGSLTVGNAHGSLGALHVDEIL